MSKVNENILVVGTYPIKNPRHGGQKRLDAIVNAYHQHFTNTLYISVFYEGFYSDYSRNDIPLGRQGIAKVEQSPMTGDIICGESIYADPDVRAKFSKVLKSFHPDVIHIEQPFPYLGIKPLLVELGMTPKIIFGSQNIEAPMKREILESYHTPDEVIKEVEGQIGSLETELSLDADLVVACTESDLEAHRRMGARKLAVAPNGVSPLETTSPALKYWENIYSQRGINRTAVFVASAHPPAWTGFLKMVGKALGFIPYGSAIVGAGSVCDFMTSDIKDDSFDINDATFWQRAYAAGRLSEERLRAIIMKADIMLLPITEGGGSNLKTAEAIIADKKVVATSHALRSFEWFREFPNVWVTDDPKEYRQAIVEALSAEKIDRSVDQRKQAESVLWSNCLKEMVEEVIKL